MDYKEKLKAIINSDKTPFVDIDTFLKYFPELKESEDEKIRKNLIGYIKGVNEREVCKETLNEWIAWLEKQGDANKEYWRGYREGKQEILDKYAELEKQGEQKPTNEPKYKVGDIIRRKKGDGLEWTVEEVFNNGYYTIVCANRDDFILLDDNWELVEQKPDDKIEPKFNVGDKIQYLKGCGTIMTIEKIENGEYIFANNLGHTTIEDGNKWYLVERNHTWSEEDEKIALSIEQVMNCASLLNIVPDKVDKIRTWLKSLKNRVGCEANFTTTKEWSEEDERHKNTIIHAIHGAGNITPIDGELAEKWLKSIRPHNRWKPSDEQMKVIEAVINNRSFQRRHLNSLYADLKILKGE